MLKERGNVALLDGVLAPEEIHRRVRWPRKPGTRRVRRVQVSDRHVVQPHYLPQIEIHSAADASKRSTRSKENSSEFFVRLYATLEGGSVTPLDCRDVEHLVNGERRQFRPDIVHRKVRGTGYTEVKVSSTRAAQEKCSMIQVRNYGFKLLDRIRAGDELPWVDYAFFRYGDRNVGQLQKLENGNLTEKLAQETRDLLIAPLPLVLLMLQNSPQELHDQTSADYSINYRSYWYVQSGMLNFFHEHGERALGKLVRPDGKIGRFTPEDLFLDKLTARHYRSPPRYYVTRSGMLGMLKPFDITKMRMEEEDYKKWLKFYGEHYEEMFDDLGISDKYVAPEELLFQV